uniref:6-phosphofructokinase 2 n=1 Tax=Arundo donax TaxID=35708 RepID=A0A0A9EEF7_ARUDO
MSFTDFGVNGTVFLE